MLSAQPARLWEFAVFLESAKWVSRPNSWISAMATVTDLGLCSTCHRCMLAAKHDWNFRPCEQGYAELWLKS